MFLRYVIVDEEVCGENSGCSNFAYCSITGGMVDCTCFDGYIGDGLLCFEG